MSGYDKTTGVFEITSKKAYYWLQREVPQEIQRLGTMGICAHFFREAGYEILKQGSGYIRVKATPEQVWEALSGKPSNPERAKWYYQ